MTDWFDEAEKAMDTEPDFGDIEYWNPEPGQIIKCKMISAVAHPWKHGKMITMVVEVIEADGFTPGSQAKIGCSRTMLRRQVLETVPAVGTMMAIKYFGKTEGKKNDYHDYKVRVQSADAEYWGPIGVELNRVPDHQLPAAPQHGVAPAGDPLDAPF